MPHLWDCNLFCQPVLPVCLAMFACNKSKIPFSVRSILRSPFYIPAYILTILLFLC